MATAERTTERPGSPEEAAELLRTLGEAGKAVRPRGGVLEGLRRLAPGGPHRHQNRSATPAASSGWRR